MKGSRFGESNHMTRYSVLNQPMNICQKNMLYASSISAAPVTEDQSHPC